MLGSKLRWHLPLAPCDDHRYCKYDHVVLINLFEIVNDVQIHVRVQNLALKKREEGRGEYVVIYVALENRRSMTQDVKFVSSLLTR